LRALQSAVVNWGIAIILLTIVVKLATLYWTHKSMVSMKRMAKLKPQLEKIKEKYKDDRQRQQAETMNLFKANNVNPMAGCLPMLLQMPVWFALYRSLSVAAELYQAKFLWLDDLTAADPYFILPVFMTAMMLVQGRLQPQTAAGGQQKFLTYGMPAIFGVMSLFFPAGLTLYISTNSLLTLGHHFYLRRADKRAAPLARKVEGSGGQAVIDVEAREAGEPAAGAKNGQSKGGKGKKCKRGGRRPGAES
jgi:YidC/Oxa1 family membrane protein insertase